MVPTAVLVRVRVGVRLRARVGVKVRESKAPCHTLSFTLQLVVFPSLHSSPSSHSAFARMRTNGFRGGMLGLGGRLGGVDG